MVSARLMRILLEIVAGGALGPLMALMVYNMRRSFGRHHDLLRLWRVVLHIGIASLVYLILRYGLLPMIKGIPAEGSTWAFFGAFVVTFVGSTGVLIAEIREERKADD